jgi:6-pyruvoyltetrahydropterin/6-carboxytetrahydropterin synthase
MFEVSVTVPLRFKHKLEGFGDDYRVAHEHTWDVTVAFRVRELDERGVGLDFVQLKKELAELLSPFQNVQLNEAAPFRDSPPTAENIAKWVAGSFSTRYHDVLSCVKVGSPEENVTFFTE